MARSVPAVEIMQRIFSTSVEQSKRGLSHVRSYRPKVPSVRVLPVASTAAQSRRLAGRLSDLATALRTEDAEGGSVNLYGVAVLHAVVSRKRSAQCLWSTVPLAFALLQIFALHSIAFGSAWTKCVYDQDCALGTACIRVNERSPQYFCADCANIVGDGDQEWSLSPVETALGFDTHWNRTTYEFTPALTGDLYPIAASAYEWCQNFVDASRTPFVSAWLSVQSQDFSHCLHVQEALHKFGALDLVVVVTGFVLVCLAIAADRQQQLLNRHLRVLLLPPPWRSLRALSFVVLEMSLEALLPSVSLAMVLLIIQGGVDATGVLLNGVAVCFVLTIDDEVPHVLLSAADKLAIDNFATAAGDRNTLVNIKRKSLCHAATALVLLFLMFFVCQRATCDNLVLACFGLCCLTPLCTRLAEEMVGLPYTLGLSRANRSEAMRRTASSASGEVGGAEESRIPRTVSKVERHLSSLRASIRHRAAATVRICSGRAGLAALHATRCLLEGMSTTCVLLLFGRLAISLCMWDMPFIHQYVWDE